MLEISQLSFRYQFKTIFTGLSFKVEPGEVVHIVGPNGSGKTTLMSILAGLRLQNGGEIRYHDSSGHLVDDRRAYVEYLPAEANALYGKMDAMNNLRFWLRLRGLPEDEATIRAVLKRWELDHPLVRQNFAVESFSTGMKRRLALARLELARTPCWLLDEPLYGLDSKGIASFQALLAEHQARGGMTVIVSHDVAPLEVFTLRRLDLLEEGRAS